MFLSAHWKIGLTEQEASAEDHSRQWQAEQTSPAETERTWDKSGEGDKDDGMEKKSAWLYRQTEQTVTKRNETLKLLHASICWQERKETLVLAVCAATIIRIHGNLSVLAPLDIFEK